MNKTFGESGGARLEAPVSSPRGQEAEQVVYGVTWIVHNCDRFAGDVYVLQGGDRDISDLSSHVHYALQGFSVVVSAAPAPYSDATGMDAFSSASVECAHDGWWRTCPLEFAEEVEASLGFFLQ